MRDHRCRFIGAVTIVAALLGMPALAMAGQVIPYRIRAESRILEDHDFSAIAAMPDGSRVVATADECEPECGLFVFDTRDPWAPRHLGTLARPGLERVLVSDDGRWAFALAAGDNYKDTSVLIVDLADPANPMINRELAGIEARSVDASADGRVLVIGGADGVVRIVTRDDAGAYGLRALLGPASIGLSAGLDDLALSEDGSVLFVFEGFSYYYNADVDEGRTFVLDIRVPNRVALVTDPPMAILDRYNRAVRLRGGPMMFVGWQKLALVGAADGRFVVERRTVTDTHVSGLNDSSDLVDLGDRRRVLAESFKDLTVIDGQADGDRVSQSHAAIAMPERDYVWGSARVGSVLYVATSAGIGLVDLDRAIAGWPREPMHSDLVRLDSFETTARRIPGEPWRRPDAWTTTDAILHMGLHPNAAAAAFWRNRSNLMARVHLALLVQLTRSPSAAKNEDMDALLEPTRAWLDRALPEDFEPLPSGHDGTLKSLEPFVIRAAAAEGFEIDCELLKRFPALVGLLEPRFGGNRDNFLPDDTCDLADYPLPDSVSTYLNMLMEGQNTHCRAMGGSLRFSHAVRENLEVLVRHVLPVAYFGVRPPMGIPRSQLKSIPLEAWSLRGVFNRRHFLRLLPLFHRARTDLAKHYADRFKLPAPDALLAAHRALWPEVLEGYSVDNAEPVRAAILTGEPIERIERLLAMHGSEPFVVAAESARDIDANWFGWPNDISGPLEPLAMTAVLRPDVLERLLELGAYRDETNAFGKTALMAAAQVDRLASIDVLIAAGADVNAQTFAPDRIPNNAFCDAYRIVHGQRTALMYAAANASLPVIERLIAAGADPRARDSKGLAAYHYLVGDGPVPANPVLSAEEMAVAERLLAP